MDKYLIQLLKEVSTIIIPGIGALTIVNQVTGEVMFLSFMKFDDEKLATYIAEKEGWSLNDAKNLVAKYVRDINAKLAVGDTYDMYQFGSFSKNKEGEIEFASWEGKKSTKSEDSKSAGIISDEVSSSVVEEVASEIAVSQPLDEVTKIEEDFSFELDADNITETAKSTVESNTDEPISIDLENIEFNLEKESILESDETIDDKLKDVSETKDIKKKASEALKAEKKIEKKPIKKTDKAVKKVDSKVKDKVKKEESSIKEKIAGLVENTKETPVIEKVVEVVSKSIPVVPAMLSVEDQLNDDLDVAPINEVKPVVIKPILEKTVSDEKRKKRRIPVFLWILLGLLIGGGIYAAINYDNLKQHIPFLADNSSKATEKTEQTIIEKDSSSDEVENSNGSETETNLDSNEATNAETAAPIAKVPPVISASNSGFTVNKSLPFQVIVGSFSEKSNADRKVKSLKSEGFSPEIIGQYDGLYFVSLGSFNSMSEVKANASKISEVGSYWVFKK